LIKKPIPMWYRLSIFLTAYQMLYFHLNHQLLDISFTDHGRMYIFGKENDKLPAFEPEIHVRSIIIKEYILFRIILPLWLLTIRPGFPADLLIPLDKNLDIDMSVVTFEFF